MRIVRQVFDDRGDGNVSLIHQVQRLAERILVTEIARDGPFGHYDVCRPCQRGLRVAANEFEVEEFEYVRVSDNQVVFAHPYVAT